MYMMIKIMMRSAEPPTDAPMMTGRPTPVNKRIETRVCGKDGEREREREREKGYAYIIY